MYLGSALGEAAGGQSWQAEVGIGEEAEVHGVAIQADVLEQPACVSLLPSGSAECVRLHSRDHIVLQRAQQVLPSAQAPVAGTQSSIFPHVAGEMEAHHTEGERKPRRLTLRRWKGRQRQGPEMEKDQQEGRREEVEAPRERRCYQQKEHEEIGLGQ